MEKAAVLSVIVAGIITIILSSGLCYYLVQRAKSTWKFGNAPDVKKLEQRLESLENRLTDIQDIVLSIDDQLKRQPSTPLSQ